MKPRSILIFLLGAATTCSILGVGLSIPAVWIPCGVAAIVLSQIID